jgi:hypothetical protein
MATHDDNIYVGYLPVPKRYASWLRIIIPLLIGSIVGIGAAVSATMGRTGTGVWNTDETATITGVVREYPYPHLETNEGPVLLVEVGKFGSSDRVIGLEGRAVNAVGTTLSRGDWQTLEVESLELLTAESEEPATTTLVSDVVVTGEIVDSKCFLGAMKPGDGRTHRACAILCIRGGIAPVLVGQTDTGEHFSAVVTNSTGAPMSADMLDFVGLPITLSGTMGDHGTLPVVRINEETVRLNR